MDDRRVHLDNAVAYARKNGHIGVAELLEEHVASLGPEAVQQLGQVGT